MVTSAIAVWCTLLALAPLRRPLGLGVISFLFAFVLNELPFMALFYLALSALLAISQSGLESANGWGAVGLAGLAAAGLVLVAWRGLRTGPAVERALSEGLGSESPAPGMAAILRRHLPLGRIVFAPFFFRRRGVARVANISYGDAGRMNQLDVYRIRSQPPSAPVLVHLHGGVLFMGKKNREARPLLYRLASQGWVCISANYRLRPAVTFPEHLIDVKKVIAWVRTHAAEYGADPEMVFVAGSSSGAQLAALAALTCGDPAFQPGFEGANTSVTAAICLQGYYPSADGQEQSPFDPLARDGTGAPPFFIAHGDRDTVVPVEAARRFAAWLRSTSANPVVYAELPGGQHGFDRFHSLRFDAVVNAIEAFTVWVRARDNTPPVPHTMP